MGTLNKALGDVRRRLGNPDERVLPDETVLHFIIDIDDELVTELNLTSISWLVPRFFLNASAGEEFYPITAPDFGKGQFLVTVKESNQNHRTTLVRFVDEESLIARYGGGSRAPSGVEFSARAAALVTIAGQRKIRLGPIPSMAATYQCVYEPEIWRPQGLGDQNFPLNCFDGYLADRVAFKCWPYAGLSEPMKTDVMNVLVAEIARGDKRFWAYKQSDRQNQGIRTQPWGIRRWGRARIF